MVAVLWKWIKWTIFVVCAFAAMSVVTGGTPFRWMGQQADIIKQHTVDKVFPSMRKYPGGVPDK